ncbi:MAG: DUF488 domain-containing protein [Desertimonas sp.]
MHEPRPGGVGIRRAYDEPHPDDGYRVLVDRVWPRGRSKAVLRLDEWCRVVAPSTELRRWFGHDPARWEEFQVRYRAELAGASDVGRLAGIARRRRLTLVYGSADVRHNQAVVLAAVITEALAAG